MARSLLAKRLRQFTLLGENPVLLLPARIPDRPEFGAPGGVERVASCETRIDLSHPVFAAVTAALVAVDVLPAP